MSATPIPRTMIMTIYGDMDVSIIREKPKIRNPLKPTVKPENKINDVIKFTKKSKSKGNQIFWVCPLIEESKKVDHSSSVKRYEYLNKIFPKELVYPSRQLDNEERNDLKQILKK